MVVLQQAWTHPLLSHRTPGPVLPFMPTPNYIKAIGASLKRKRMPPAVQLSACTQNVMYADAMTAEAPAQPYSPIQPSEKQESTSVAKASQQLNHRAPEPPSQNGTTLTYMHFLVIRNFALIEEQTVHFKPGLNVLTGESGAGKSVLVDAFAQVLGMPANDSSVRPPATTASIEARIRLSPAHQAVLPKVLAGIGVPLPRALQHSLQELVLRREITQAHNSVRSRCYVQGTATSLRVLRELGAALVDINGQHSAISLRDGATQLALLDRIAGTSGKAAQFGAHVHALRQTEAQLKDLASFGSEEEREDLQATIWEIKQSRLVEGEERILRAKLRQLEARRSSVDRAGLMGLAASGEGGVGGVVEGLRTLQGHVDAILAQEEAYANLNASERDDSSAKSSEPFTSGDMQNTITSMDSALNDLEEAQRLVNTAQSKVTAYARKYQYLQQEHDEVAKRLSAVERILKQYDCSTSGELLAEAAQAEADLDRFYQSEGKEEELQAQLLQQQKQLQETGVQLSRQRRAAAKKLKANVDRCLAELTMKGSEFDVDITWQETQQAGLQMPEQVSSLVSEAGNRPYSLSPTGLDRAQFLLRAGPGEPLRPVSDVASGGESARIMLALKAAPAAAAAEMTDVDHQDSDAAASNDTFAPPLMILDELDSGVGARLGSAVGRLLKSMSGHCSRNALSQPADELTTQQSTQSMQSVQSTQQLHLQPFEPEQQHSGDSHWQSVTYVNGQPIINDFWQHSNVEQQQTTNMDLQQDLTQLENGYPVDTLQQQPQPQQQQQQQASVSQILCVSHLPQVAAHADHHICVRKATDVQGRVQTVFEHLDSTEARAEEIAAMLGLGLTEAFQLLDAAGHAT